MKKNQKNILIVSFSIIIILICFYYFLPKKNINSSDRLPQASPLVIPVTTPLQIEAKPLSGEIKKEKRVILDVLGKEYTSTINDSDSVYKVMENLQKNKANNFSFAYKEYPTLGIFIGEINGIKGGDGKYWIYFINDVEASIGVSQYNLKEGDIIKWELK